MRTLITGGIKSGKSSYAIDIAKREFSGRNFLATAIAFDDEMREKIRRHREDRAGEFAVVEEPYDIDRALTEDSILDCVPMWLNNMFFSGRRDEWRAVLDRAIAKLPRNIVVVTNETGLGIVPADAETRAWSSALGEANKALASACDRVILMVAGLPLVVKGEALGS